MKTKDKIDKMILEESDYAPIYVRIGVLEAGQGGQNSYANVGWHLGIHLFSEISRAHDEEIAEHAVAEIESCIEQGNQSRAIKILKRALPAVMQLVPSRRRMRFLSGVESAFEDGRLWN